MRTLNVSTYGQTIPLGRQRENLAQQVIFSLAKYAEIYGSGTPELWVLRAGDAVPAQPTEVTVDADNLTWSVTSYDTAVAGTGAAELRWIVQDGDKKLLAKSSIYPTVVVASLLGGEDGT